MFKLYSNEIVFRGHPDKVCDQIGAAILKECIRQDKNTRAGIEVCGGKGKIFITGEITTLANFDVDEITRRVLKDVGYDFNKYEIINNIGTQSLDIAMGVNQEKEIGAGDQGMCFGYACSDTDKYLPKAMVILQEFAEAYDKLRKENEDFLPDGKAQITGAYDEDFKLKYIDTFLISYQNTESHRNITDKIIIEIAKKFCDKYDVEVKHFLINPTGKFQIGGFEGDAGLTGRKIVVDAYESFANVGGGCVDKDTEFLTLDGWKKINEFNKDNLVAQWNNENLEFVKPINFVKLPKERMFRVVNQTSLDMVLSENHNVLYRNPKNKKLDKDKMINIYLKHFSNSQGNRIEIPVFFKNDFRYNSGIELSDDEIRLQIAFCADGTISDSPKDKWGGRIRIKKQYKIERLEKLLNKVNISYKKSVDNEFFIYYLNPPILTRSLFECFKNCNLAQMKILKDEIFMWDGNRKDLFRTTNKKDADFIQFVLQSLTGKRVSLTKDDRLGQPYSDGKYIRKSINYNVCLCQSTYTGLRRNKDIEKTTIIMEEFKSDDEYMYCINVPSHNLILRRNDRIFITGNCMNGKDP